MASTQTSGAHEPVDALVGQQVPARGQTRPHPPDTGIAAGVGMQPLHDRNEGRVVLRTLRGPAGAPGVVARPGHPQVVAHERDRIRTRISPVRASSEDHCLDFANQVATFFANSTCILSSAIVALSSSASARSRISSTRSETVNSASGGTANARASLAFFTHLPNVIS